jgi:multidrug transporter EmrE-like cation transporter
MLVYKAIHPNVALALATAGSFVLSQIALVVFFKSELVPMQWAGMMVIVIGIVMLSNGGTVKIG